MTASIEIVYCVRPGAKDVTAPPGGTPPAGRSAVLGAQALNNLAAATTADAFVFVESHGQVGQELNDAAELLDDRSALAAVVVSGADDRLTVHCWQELPAAVAALAWPWVPARPLCIRKSAWDKTGRFRDGSDPIWEWLVRAAGSGREIACAAPERMSGLALPDSEELPALAPRTGGRQRAWLRERIAAGIEGLIGRVASPADAVALKAGLFQLHDWLDDSHAQSQSVEGRGRRQAGDYWHAIMHRREPDDSNAKYWFRQVGGHPVFRELATEADRILAACPAPAADEWRERLGVPAHWDAFAFVDLCAECRRGGDAPLEMAARRIQLVEMLLLLIHTYRDAAGLDSGDAAVPPA